MLARERLGAGKDLRSGLGAPTGRPARSHEHMAEARDTRQWALSLALLFVAISLGALGQVLLKSGLRELGERPPPLVALRSIFTNRLVFSGFACYGLSSLLYIVALSRLDLSYAYPMIAISYVMVAVLAWRFLNEPIPALRVVGLVVVMVGVTILAFSHARPTHPRADHAPPAVTQPTDSP